MRVLIVGCGYVGLAAGSKLRAAGHEVFGLRRSAEPGVEVRQAGIQPIQADLTRPESLGTIRSRFDGVVLCAAAGGGGVDAYRRLYVEGTRNLLSWLTDRMPERFIYTGSTSVYGQSDGSWVTEESPTEPVAETAKVLAEAEQLIRDAHCVAGLPGITLRLAGIYGPDRGYWLKQFLSGQATMDGEGTRYLNLVHRDDVAGAIVATLNHGLPGATYNVVDNEPVAQRDLFAWLSTTLGKPMPPASSLEASLRKRGVTNKRVSNQRLRDELGYSLRFPTFREGFRALLSAPA